MNRKYVIRNVYKNVTTFVRKLIYGKDVYFYIALFLCCVNLFYMHYRISSLGCLEDDINLITIADNLFGVCFDIFFLFFCLYFITRTKLNVALSLTFFISLLWSFSNILYSRFFRHYLTLSAIEQGRSLKDTKVFYSVLDGIRFEDCYYIIVVVLFVLILKRIQKGIRPISFLVKTLVIIAVVDISLLIVSCVLNPEFRYVGYFFQQFGSHHFSSYHCLCKPNDANFRRGTIRTMFWEVSMNCRWTQITDEQRELIEDEIGKHKQLFYDNNVSVENVIFIVVESYMSFTSEMKVDAREVTPFLNSLKRDSMVYYNGDMKENVTIGESSDGQFIYMTGLLPLRSVITISKARQIPLPGLPKIIGKESRMIIPTPSSMWNQDEMCHRYGISHLYTSNDFEGEHDEDLNDEQVFKLAAQIDRLSKRPFFSVILTMSMHQPYNKDIDSTYSISDSSIPKDLSCYLNACHYTDRQIEMYFDHLKQTGLYDNSLIIIAADHPVHSNGFGGVPQNIPLYIVCKNGLPNRMHRGECNQIDVFPTLLDLLCCNSKWYGLGWSLLSVDYNNVIPEQKWNISEWMILGNFFENFEF